jgi:hypothetical protein
VRTALDPTSRPDIAGIAGGCQVSQRRQSRISSINTGELASIRRQLRACRLGIPYRCFVGVGLTWMPCLPLCAGARGLQGWRQSGIDLTAFSVVL